MTNTEIRLNPIEERLLFHWETLLETDKEVQDVPLYDVWHDETANQIRIEVNLFIDQILPVHYPLCDWAFWTDGTEILTKSEELADRLAKIVDVFGLSRTGYYDPEEDERNGETNDHTGYWYVTWD